MGVISIREFNSNVSRALARVEAGEILEITRNGKIVAELRPKSGADEAARAAARRALRQLLKTGSLPFGGPASYEERTG